MLISYGDLLRLNWNPRLNVAGSLPHCQDELCSGYFGALRPMDKQKKN